jgi:hypothetical protein
LANFIDQHWVMGGAATALLWMVGGIKSRKSDSLTALGWLTIGTLIAIVDVYWGFRVQQCGGLALGIVVLAFGFRQVHSTLLQKRAQTVAHHSSDTAQIK